MEPFIGEVRMFSGNFAPRGWALCDGQLLAVSQYDALFSLLGTIYGGDGRTTFALPDLRGRIPIHYGQGAGLTTRRQGSKAGAEQVAVTIPQMPSHNHALQATTDSANSADPNASVPASNLANTYVAANPDVAMASQMVSNNGQGQAHNNVMPFQCVNYIIALFGIYPSRN